MMKKLLLVLSLIFSFIFAFPQNTFASSWLADYNYRKTLTVTGSSVGALSNYQLLIALYKGVGTDSNTSYYLNNHALDNFNDIRFTSDDGLTLLGYWIQSSDSNSATVWVKLDSIPASPSQKTFYLYYGSSAAASLSSGPDTFNLFDDFDADGISNWLGSNQNKHVGESATQMASSLKSVTSPNSAMLYTYANCNTDPWDGVASILTRTVNISTGTYKVDFDVLRDIIDFRFDTLGNEKSIVKINGTASFDENTNCTPGNCDIQGTWAEKSFTVDNSPITTIALEGYSDDCTSGKVWFDNVRIRNYVSPEPLLTVADDQETTAPDVSPSSSSSNSSSNSSSPSTPPVCSDAAPFFAPDLFQIDTTKNTAKLFFTPLPDTSRFVFSFSTHPNAEEFGADLVLDREGVQNFTVNFLQSNKTYYFKVRGQNGCATGPWSRIFKIKTGNSNKFYKTTT